MPSTPYKTLGDHLKYLRKQSNESLAEVSGAVEIDENVLERIEAGKERPAEEILLLLISHFSMPDPEAVQLWELAGYSGSPEVHKPNEPAAHEDVQKAFYMFMAVDTRTVYSDGLDIYCNQAGVTLSFTQATGKPQPNIISKVGMSYEQAEQVSEVLQKALLKARYLKGPKHLPPTTD